jgi:hypothetical protein
MHTSSEKKRNIGLQLPKPEILAPLLIAPPDVGKITDEDSGEEEGGTMNNLSKGQLL